MKFEELEEDYIPRTITEGLSDYNRKTNSLMIEETNYGRLVEIDMDSGKIIWQYVNKADIDQVPLSLKALDQYLPCLHIAI